LLPDWELPVSFDRGLLGFPTVREYRLRRGPGEDLFWLEAAAGFPRFLLADPFPYFEDFPLRLLCEQLGELGDAEPESIAVLAVTVPAKPPAAWTANLQGPVVIDTRTLKAAQIVLSDPSIGVRRPFKPRRTATDPHAA
jgi:flagellar assembly factor FliW